MSVGVSGAVGGQPDVLSSVDMTAQRHTAADISHHSADVTAQRHSADVTTQRHTADVTAQRHSADVTVQRHTADVTAQRHSADVTAQRHTADVTAQRHATTDISHHSSDANSPSLPVLQNIASLSLTAKTVATVESANKSPTAHNGIETLHTAATTVDASARQTPIDPSVIPVRYYVISLTILLGLL